MPSLGVDIDARVNMRGAMEIAKQNLAELKSTFKDTTKEMTVAGAAATEAQKSNFYSLTASVMAAEGQLKSLAREYGASFRSATVGDATTAMEGFGHATTRAKTEIIVLGHEMLQGRFTRVPGSLMVMAEGMGGIGASALAAAAPIAALAAGFYELSRRAEESRTEIIAVQDALAGVGKGAAETTPEIARSIEALAELPNVSTDMAAKMVAAFARVRSLSREQADQLNRDAAGAANAYGDSADKMAEEFAKAFTDIGKGGKELDDRFTLLTAGQRAEFEAAGRVNDTGRQQTIIITALNARFADMATKLVDGSERLGLFDRMLQAVGRTAATADANLAGIDTAKLFAPSGPAQTNAIGADEDVKKRALETEDRILGALDRETELRTELTQLQNLGVQAGEAEVRRQQAMAEIEAKMQEEEQRNIDKQLEAERQASAARQRLVDEGYKDRIAHLETQRAALQKGSEVEIALLHQEAAVAMQTYGQRSVQYEETIKKIEQAEQQHQATMKALEREGTDTDIQVARVNLQAKKDALDAEVSAGQITAAQALAIQRELVTQEYQLDLDALQNEISGLQQGTLEYQKAYDQRRVLAAKLQADLAALDRQQAAAAKKTAEQDSKAWRDSVSEIESAESQLVGSIFSRRQSLAQSLMQISARLVQSELTDDAKLLTEKLLVDAKILTADKATAQGGLLAKVAAWAAEKLGIISTQTVDTTSSAETLASWTATEAAKTAATTAGVAARTAAVIAGQTAAKVSNVAEGMSEAAVGAASAGASVAAIPLVGWAMAPAVAAETYGMLAGYAGMASAAGGMLTVPSDNFLINAHANEAVLPANIATPMRDFFTNAGGGAETGQNGSAGGNTFNINSVINGNMPVGNIPDNIATAITKAVVRKMNSNPSLRPRY